jgi:signal transduction histidine kinase
MQLHDGKLITESVEAEGTTVTCRFPAKRVEGVTTHQSTVS